MRLWKWWQEQQRKNAAVREALRGGPVSALRIGRQERKAQEHVLKAGKTFRRTRVQLRKAARHERRAERLR